MATPFDATTKELVRLQPEDWLELLGLPHAECEVIDADLATVSTEADRLIRVKTPAPYLVHLEFQAGHDGHAASGRMLRYNVLASEQVGLSVLSYVILLRPEADSPSLVGKVERFRPDRSRYLVFDFGVLRLWQVPVARVLSGGVAILPLALLCDLAGSYPEQVVTQLEDRLEREVSVDERRRLWASVYLLAGIRFAPEIAGKLLEKAVAQMKESMTYQKILADGREEGRLVGETNEARNLIRRLGARRFGAPPGWVEERLSSLSDLVALEALADKLLEVESWQELLG